MRVCVVGGIFDKPAPYRERHAFAPEVILAEGLRSLGFEVRTAGHRSRLRYRDYDLVHVHHLGRAAARAGLGRMASHAGLGGVPPLVFTPHAGNLLVGGRRRVRERLALWSTLRGADAVVALSRVEARYLESLRFRRAEIRVIGNGIPTDVFRPAAVGPDTGERGARWSGPRRPGTGLGLLYVGHLIELKGLDLLFRALARLREHREVRLRLAYQTAGDEARLRRLAASLGIESRLDYLGFLGPEELVREYRRADLLVLPSRAEALPSCIAEALLCGTPVVATKVGGVPEQVGDLGILLPPDDAEALADGIRRAAAALPALRRRIHAALPVLRDRFRPDRMAREHASLYAALLEAHPDRRSGRLADTVAGSGA